MVDERKDTPFRNLEMSNEERVTKILKPQANEKMTGRTKNPRPTNTSTIISTLISILASQKSRLHPHHQGRVGHVPSGGASNFKPDPVGGTASVYREGGPTKLEYLIFDPGGILKMNWRPT